MSNSPELKVGSGGGGGGGKSASFSLLGPFTVNPPQSFGLSSVCAWNWIAPFARI